MTKVSRMLMDNPVKRIKVLHVLEELCHSGAEVMLQQACGRFEKNDIDSHILSAGDVVGKYAAILEQTGYKIHHIPFRKTAGFFADILQFLTREKFAVVHIHTERAFFWYSLLAKLAGVQTIVRTIHNVFLFSGYLRWKRQWQRTISRSVFGAVHTAISDSVLTEEKQRFGNHCVLIQNWTDTEKFRPPSDEERAAARRLYGLEPENFVLVSVGSCTPVKNHLDVCSAVKRLNDAANGRKIVLLHLGTGPMLEEEQTYVRSHRLEPYFRFVGLLDDVRPCLYASDAFVMTSLWEGLGIAALEAMSTALPVVLYDVPGLRDLLQDGKGGLLIGPHQNALVDAVSLLISHPELCEEYGRGAREVVLSTYSMDQSVDQFIDIYRTGGCR